MMFPLVALGLGLVLVSAAPVDKTEDTQLNYNPYKFSMAYAGADLDWLYPVAQKRASFHAARGKKSIGNAIDEDRPSDDFYGIQPY